MGDRHVREFAAGAAGTLVLFAGAAIVGAWKTNRAIDRELEVMGARLRAHAEAVRAFTPAPKPTPPADPWEGLELLPTSALRSVVRLVLATREATPVALEALAVHEKGAERG